MNNGISKSDENLTFRICGRVGKAMEEKGVWPRGWAGAGGGVEYRDVFCFVVCEQVERCEQNG